MASNSNDPALQSVADQNSTSAGLFVSGRPERTPASMLPWVIACVAVLLVLGALLLAGRHRSRTAANTLLPLDAYASSLPISGLALSESTSLSGGKSTFLDGRIRNSGTRTVTGATVQVVFANDESLPPQIETFVADADPDPRTVCRYATSQRGSADGG